MRMFFAEKRRSARNSQGAKFLPEKLKTLLRDLRAKNFFAQSFRENAIFGSKKPPERTYALGRWNEKVVPYFMDAIISTKAGS